MFDDLPGLLDDLRSLYEDLHAHPELSFAEHSTATLLGDRLEGLGYTVTRHVGGTGVVATLDNGVGPSVLLRADIDALPVTEETGLPYASIVRSLGEDGREVGVAHACGHDMHAAWMIGAATLLARQTARWSGRVLIVLQPAEELASGARAMIEDGLFERFGTPDVALGQHVAPAPAGTVYTRPGVTMAATDALRIVLHGRGGHGAAPERTVDPVVMAASTVMRLQTIVSREVAPTDAAVVTVGTLHAGTKENIIGDDAEMTLTVRTFDPHVRTHVLAAIARVAEGESAAAAAPAPPEVTTFQSFPALTNEPGATARVAAAFAGHFGPERALVAPPATASEDFGLYAERGGIPSTFWFVGGTDPELFARALRSGRLAEDVPFNHSPRYAPVEDPTLATGVEAMVTAAMCWLGG